MFAVVVPQTPAPPSLFTYLGRFLRPPEPDVTTQKFLGTPYCRIVFPQRCPPEELLEAVGRFSRRVVLSKQLLLPDDFPLASMDPSPFLRHLCQNTALKILKESRIPLYAKRVGVIDPQGVCQDFVRQLLLLCPHVCVLTEQREAYEDFAREMMDAYGAPILLGEEPHILRDCLLVTAPTAFAWTGYPLEMPVLSAVSQSLPGLPYLISGLEPGLSEEARGELPEGVDPVSFCSAVWQAGDARIFEGCTAARCFCGKNPLEPSEISRWLERQFQKLCRSV